mmetsp:Transcript_20714/g.27226  ORF Transcript_20714/g.27226 Transcript_20714/m.27226 type:complete len:271 (-) Transcript_20714:1384-2196(-)
MNNSNSNKCPKSSIQPFRKRRRYPRRGSVTEHTLRAASQVARLDRLNSMSQPGSLDNLSNEQLCMLPSPIEGDLYHQQANQSFPYTNLGKYRAPKNENKSGEIIVDFPSMTAPRGGESTELEATRHYDHQCVFSGCIQGRMPTYSEYVQKQQDQSSLLRSLMQKDHEVNLKAVTKDYCNIEDGVPGRRGSSTSSMLTSSSVHTTSSNNSSTMPTFSGSASLSMSAPILNDRTTTTFTEGGELRGSMQSYTHKIGTKDSSQVHLQSKSDEE